MSVVYVARENLRESLLRLWRRIGSHPAAQFSLTALGNELILEYGGASESVQAISTDAAGAYWGVTLPFLDPSKFATRLPVEDPLRITRTEHRIAVAGFSTIAVASDARGPLLNAELTELYERAARAADLLRQYGVGERDLLSLCEPATRPLCRFDAEEQAITKRVGEVWAELAPYGLDPYDLRKFVAARARATE
jgi:hypothetical protein